MKAKSLEIVLWTTLVCVAAVMVYLGRNSYHITDPYFFLIVLMATPTFLILAFRMFIQRSKDDSPTGVARKL